MGKTTLATKAGNALLLAFERGYNALPGVRPVDITTWSKMREVLRELKKDDVRAAFQSVIFDTIDIAGELCERYVCSQNGVDKIGEIAYGQGWNLMKKEFSDVVRTITQLGYAVFFISHDKDKEFKRKDGTSYNQIIPSCPNSFNNIAKDLADIYAYSEKYEDGGIAKVKLILRSIDNSIDTGCRFKYIAPECDMSYDALVAALNEAIEVEAKLTNGAYITNDRNVQAVTKTYDFEGLIGEFNKIAAELMEKDATYFQPRIIHVVETYLGKGKKVTEATIDQVELIDLIVGELKELGK